MTRQHTSTSPPCPHFGTCGGCTLQHLSAEEYCEHKTRRLKRVLERSDFLNDHLRPLYEIGPHTRRRTDLKIRVEKGKVRLGYFAAKSQEWLVDITTCPILDPEVETLILGMKKGLEGKLFTTKLKGISVVKADIGMEIILISDTLPSARDKVDILELFKDGKDHRLIWQCGDGDGIIIQQADVAMRFSENTRTSLPSDAFLQAAVKAQNRMTKIILKHLSPGDRVADLYAGCGTFSFPAWEKGCVVAGFEGDPQMVRVAQNAVLPSKENKPAFHQRDLYKKPLSAKELNEFDAVIINPPRNGATPQFENISLSKIKKLIVVSCDPSSLERDLKELKGCGFKALYAEPIDQFVWSEHLESVVVLGR